MLKEYYGIDSLNEMTCSSKLHGLRVDVRCGLRGAVKIHNRWLQPKCCSIQQLHIAFPI